MNSPANKIPECMGFILDGNRRWAKQNGKPTLFGHKAGYDNAKEMVKWAKETGVKYVMVYAFSTENWNRAKEEVSYLMDLLHAALTKDAKFYKNENVRVRCVGDLAMLPKKLQAGIVKTEKETAKNTGITFVVCVSYGGRNEILNTVKRLAKEKTPAEIEKMTEADFGKALYTHDIPDPDIIVRTSGEMRLSNFLPWQGVYSELFFVKTLWPDFSQKDFKQILAEYAERERRRGK